MNRYKWNSSNFFKYSNYHDIEDSLNHGADPNARDKDGNSPFHHIASSGTVRMAIAVFRRGGLINARNNDGDAPIHIAVKRGYRAMIRAFKDFGANLNLKNINGETAYSLAKKSLRAVMLITALSASMACSSNSFDANSGPPVAEPRMDLIKYHLVDPDTLHDIPDEQGWKAAHHAAFDHDLEALEELDRLGFDMLAVTNDGQTIAHISSMTSGDNGDVLRFAKKKGVDIDLPDKWKNPALFYNIKDQNHAGTKTLLDLGADKNRDYKNEMNMGAMDIAVLERYIDSSKMLHLLHDNGYILDKNNGPKTAMAAILTFSAPKTLETIFDLGVDPTANIDLKGSNMKLIDYARLTKAIEIIETVEKAIAKKEAQDAKLYLNMTDKEVAFHEAAHHGKDFVINMIMTPDLNLDVKDANGKTALDKAHEGGHKNVVDMIENEYLNRREVEHIIPDSPWDKKNNEIDNKKLEEIDKILSSQGLT